MNQNPIVNPRLFVVDDTIKAVEEDKNVDLLASNAPTVGAGKYVCFSYKVPKGSVLVVGGIAVYAQQRINVGAGNDSPPSESKQYIDPDQGSGWFAFAPQINATAMGLSNMDFAAPRVAAGTLNDKDRQKRPGISMLSKEPRRDAHLMWQNPLYKFLVPSDALLQVIFEILPVAKASPLPANGRYTIGVAAEQTRRVDYAGAYVVGNLMAEQRYKELLDDVKRGVI